MANVVRPNKPGYYWFKLAQDPNLVFLLCIKQKPVFSKELDGFIESWKLTSYEVFSREEFPLEALKGEFVKADPFEAKT